MAFSGKDLDSFVKNLRPGFLEDNPQLKVFLEADLQELPWTKDPNWQEKEEREIEATRARIVAIMLRKGKLLQEYEERFGRSYYG